MSTMTPSRIHGQMTAELAPVGADVLLGVTAGATAGAVAVCVTVGAAVAVGVTVGVAVAVAVCVTVGAAVAVALWSGDAVADVLGRAVRLGEKLEIGPPPLAHPVARLAPPRSAARTRALPVKRRIADSFRASSRSRTLS
ncbi:MAG: hypothetical protein ACLPN6_26330 [Streptosporangiaceae bacterium]